MAKIYRVNSVIICDDLRIEVGGKEFIIGVYSGFIYAETLPILLPTFVVRISLSLKQNLTTGRVQIRNPRNLPIVDTELTFGKARRLDIPATVPFKVTPMVFDQYGRHTIHFSVEDGPLDRIASFELESSISHATSETPSPPGEAS